MAINIRFDTANNPEIPIFILAYRNGERIGLIDNITEYQLHDYLNDCPEISFTVYKTDNETNLSIWDNLRDFMLCYCSEWDTWFEMTVSLNESESIRKNIILKRLSEAELSQINVYNIEINTEPDIARDDYKPTILYDSSRSECSLLHRILEKAPHYSIRHVDKSIQRIQRTFSFDGESIKDVLDSIAEEINCLVVYHADGSGSNGITRAISLYDLESNCLSCGHRGEFTQICPECNATNILEGYGEDTTIFISTDDLGEDITLETNTDSVKNCFKLVAGDDLMTATIRNCNPNGTDYIWYFSDEAKEIMPSNLVTKLNEYTKHNNYYQKEHVTNLNTSKMNSYNNLVNKYKTYNSELQTISSSIIGFGNVMKGYYNTIDFYLYLDSVLMPDATLSDTSASKQLSLLNRSNLSPVAVTDSSSVSVSTANSAILSVAQAVIDSRYSVKILESSLENRTWKGKFAVTNRSDEEDTSSNSTFITIEINDEYETFVKQKIDKTLKKKVEDLSIVGLFKKDLSSFKSELKKYCSERLTSFHDACQAVIDVMVEQGVGNAATWAKEPEDLYQKLYVPYYNKLKALQSEMKLRDNEKSLVEEVQTLIENARKSIQKKLDFETFLGTQLWLTFCSYLREDTYENSNYISDGLNNQGLFDKAFEFIEVAEREIYKSATAQHSISANVKNLLAIDQFKPLINKFSCGNWLRIRVDNDIYKLRLLEYELDSEMTLSVVFSDVVKTVNGLTDIKSILSQASSMTSNYASVKRQASQGSNSNRVLNNWFMNGLDATLTKIVSDAKNQNISWDSNGFLCREYNDLTDSYSDKQLKIINKGLYLTNDGWETSRAGIGNFIYFDPKTQTQKEAYGVIADTLCSSLVLSEEVSIYNPDASIEIGKDGIVITTEESYTNHVFMVRKKTSDNKYKNQLYIDNNGNLILADGVVIDANGTYINSDHTDTLASFIKAQKLSADEIDAIVANIITLNAESILTKTLNAKYASIEHLQTNYADINQLNANFIQANQLAVKMAEIINADIENANITNATIEALNSKYITTDKFEANVADIVKANIGSITSNYIQTGELDSYIANIVKADITSATIEALDAKYANIDFSNTQLAVIVEGYVGKLVADYIRVEELDAHIANIIKADITNATIEALESKYATIETLNTTTGKIDNIINNFFTSDDAQIIRLTSANLIVDKQTVNDLFAKQIDVSVLNSGTINSSKINIKSESGNLLVADNTIQIKDNNDKVRVQIGEDETGDYNLIILNKEGTGRLFDADGIKETAIADGMLKSEKLANIGNGYNGIGADKLNINSIVTGINNGTTAISSHKVYFDDENKTLNTIMKTLSTTMTQVEGKLRYTVVITSSKGTSIASDEITVLSANVYEYGTQNLATGTFTYQWYKNGQAISNANKKDYSVDASTLSNGAQFTCKISYN